MSLLLRNNITLLVSDMAGTIINEKGLIYKALGNTLKGLGYCVSDADVKNWHGRDKRAVLYDHIYKQYDPPGVRYIAPKVTEAENLLLKELEQVYFEDKNIELIEWGEVPTVDMIINATTIGLKKDDVMKLDFSLMSGNKFFYDVIYNPNETNFLKIGKELGNKTLNGKLMFIYQALSAFKIWHGIEPDVNKEVIKLLDR